MFKISEMLYTNTMLDSHYQNPLLTNLYDIGCGWSKDRDYYLNLPESPCRILDLGCGTGLLCRHYALAGHEVIGVDPAQEMLNIGADKRGGDQVQWIQARAQDFKHQTPFDLIIMTGHAFQVLLHSKEILETFHRVKAVLSPQGRFVFESRNPEFDWASHWNYKTEYQFRDQFIQESRELISYDGNIMHFVLNYQFPNSSLSSASTLKFTSAIQIQQWLAEANLKILASYGDWDETPISVGSEEMIFHVGHQST